MNARQLHRIAKQYLQAKEKEKALETINQAIALKPTAKENYLLRGEIYFLLKKYDQALEEFSKVISLDANDAEARLYRGIVFYEGFEKNNLAIVEFNRAIKLTPKNDKAYLWKGRALRKNGNLNEAMNCFNTAIQLNPTEAYNYNARANLHEDFGRYIQAMNDYNKCIELKPSKPLFLNNRGTTYVNLQRFEYGIIDYNKAISMEPDYNFAYENRTVAFLRSGKINLALRDYYFISEKNLNSFVIEVRVTYPRIKTQKLFENYNEVRTFSQKYQLTIRQSLLLLRANETILWWLLQTWRILSTGKNLNDVNHTPLLLPEIWWKITTHLLGCLDEDLDKLTKVVNKRFYENDTCAHRKKLSVKFCNAAKIFASFFHINVKEDNYNEVAKNRFEKRISF